MLLEASLATAAIVALVLYGRALRRIMDRLRAAGHEERVSWDHTHAVRVFGVAVIMTILGSVSAAIAARALGMYKDTPCLGALGQTFVYAFNATTVWVVFRYAGIAGSAPGALGFRTDPLSRAFRQGLVLFVMFIPFQAAAPFLIERLWVDWLRLAPSGQRALEMLLNAEMPVKLAMSFMAVVVAPFYEEVIFRAFIQPGLEKAWGRGAAITVTTLLFAAVHYQGNSLLVVLQVLPVSAAFSIFYDRTRNIVSNMVFHALFNLSTIVAVFVVWCAGLDLTV